MSLSRTWNGGRSDKPMNALAILRPWLPFRTSLCICLLCIAAVVFSGYQFDSWANDGSSPLRFGSAYYFVQRQCVPIVAALVLLIGRDAVTVPMAVGFAISAAIGLYFEVFLDGSVVLTFYFGLPLGSLLGLLRLLEQRITATRLSLSGVTAFFLGESLTIFALYF
jgi:hypothetical protein